MDLLIISTLICILEFIAPVIIKYVIMHIYCGKQYDSDIRNELISLKKEMSGLSMVDQFAKYAKLKRKYVKMESTLKERVNERSSSRLKVQTSLTFGFQMLGRISMFCLLYYYKNEPVIILPEGSLWPVHNFISWPTQHIDAISLPFWIIINRLAISAFKSKKLS